MDLSNERWSDADFRHERERVLALWPTGKEVDLEEAVDFHLRLPEAKNYAKVVRMAKEEGRTLVQPRGGVALIEGHIDLLRHLQEEGGADLLPMTTDTYTRNLKFQEAARGIAESRRLERSMLNGLPVVNHGPRAVRRVVEAELAQWWSPQQISGWLVEEFPDDAEMRVSHETIYLSLFVQSRGALRMYVVPFECRDEPDRPLSRLQRDAKEGLEARVTLGHTARMLVLAGIVRRVRSAASDHLPVQPGRR